ncbi:uncharacterized protein N7506_011313 [Penicillium brevicompactum]|nr:uncharacterized protein N7506_011313 [Penicillium brevicompactum]KAJ5322183.1 hypothetical protein N7506_011313 [Penicillium brevicompactum]
MADPEDGDDLFADLYDADESTARTTSAVDASKPAEPVATPAAPAASTTQGTESAPVDTHQSQPAAQPSGYDNGYNNGSGNPYGAAPASEAPAEPESHGTGIKEDGRVFWLEEDKSDRATDTLGYVRKDSPVGSGASTIWAPKDEFLESDKANAATNQQLRLSSLSYGHQGAYKPICRCNTLLKLRPPSRQIKQESKESCRLNPPFNNIFSTNQLSTTHRLPWTLSQAIHI